MARLPRAYSWIQEPRHSTLGSDIVMDLPFLTGSFEKPAHWRTRHATRQSTDIFAVIIGKGRPPFSELDRDFAMLIGLYRTA